jgi:hypothetical protein
MWNNTGNLLPTTIREGEEDLDQTGVLITLSVRPISVLDCVNVHVPLDLVIRLLHQGCSDRAV